MLIDIIRRWAGWIVIILVAVAVFYWGQKYTSKPDEIRIATGGKNGYYYRFGSILKKHVEKNNGSTIHLLFTKGAVDNRRKLLSGEADLAILETGTASLDNLAVVAPLWNEYFHIVIPKKSQIKSMLDLPGKRVSIAKVGSGDRANSLKIMKYYQIDLNLLDNNTASLKELMKGNLDAAIVSTSPLNPGLSKVMGTGRFTLLPINKAEGLAYHHPYFTTAVIPAGVFSTRISPVPEQPVKTVTSMAILVARKDADHGMIKKMMPILYSAELQVDEPGLLKKEDILLNSAWNLMPVHKAARSYFNPYEGVAIFSSFIEFLELYRVALILGTLILIFLIIYLASRGEEREKKILDDESRALEALFAEITRIAQNQQHAGDIRLLKQYLNEVYEIKRQALNQAAGSKVQHSSLFLAFLLESNHLIQDIEKKLAAGSMG